MVYNNVNGFPVILDDNRDPWVSWTHHRQRGSLGGVDMVAAYGTPVKAPSSGTVTLHSNTGSGGRYVTIHASGGYYDELMHLSAFKVKNGQHVTRGQVIGLSGASGYKSDHYYAPHCHWHRIQSNGVRVNPWNYFTKTPSPSTSSKPGKIVYTLRTGTPNSTFFKRLQWYGHLYGYTGPIDGKPGTSSWSHIQKGLRNWGYTGPLDGLPGAATRKGLQRMGKAHGYTGPIDGNLGKQSYIGISKRLNLL